MKKVVFLFLTLVLIGINFSCGKASSSSAGDSQLTVYFWDSPNYSGRSGSLTNDCKDLGENDNWRDKIRSLKVVGPNGKSVTVYRCNEFNTDCDGRDNPFVKFPVGSEIPDIKKYTVLSDGDQVKSNSIQFNY